MFKRILLLLISSILLFSAAGAKTLEEVRKSRKYGSLPGTYKEAINTENFSQYKMSSKELEPLLSKCKTFLSILKNQPLIKESTGFNSYGKIYVPSIEYNDAFPGKDGSPLVVDCALTIREFGEGEKGKPHESITAYSNIVIRFNKIGMIFSNMRIYLEGIGNDLYYQPKRAGEFKGYPIYHEDNSMIVINLSQKPLWLPVSAEEFIKILIQRTKAERDKEVSDMRNQKTPKEIVDSGKAERKKAFDEAYVMIKKQNPAEAEKMKKEFLQLEKQYEKEAASHNESKEDLSDKMKKHFDDLIAAYQKELSQLSPSQRKAQAYFVGETEERPSGLGDSSVEGAKPIVRQNKDYFNDNLPRNAIRCIILTFLMNGGFQNPEIFDSESSDYSLQDFVVQNLYQITDWNTVFSLLKK